MILDFLYFIFSPFIWAAERLFEGLVQITGSVGISIILLGIITAICLQPLVKQIRKFEDKNRSKKQGIDEEIKLQTNSLKGEAKFRAIVAIYEKNDYHPIQSLGTNLSLLVTLPVLIVFLLMFLKSPMLNNVSFLGISDLSKPDHLLGVINVLPLIMTVITIVDAKIRFSSDDASFYRFCVLAFVLLFLVYSAPAALIIYWMANNLTSTCLFFFKSNG